MIASGSASLKQGARLQLPLRARTKLVPGVYFTLVRVASKVDPKQSGLFVTRPYVVTKAQIAALTAAKAKAAKAGKPGKTTKAKKTAK